MPVSWTHKRGEQLDASSNDSESGSNDSDSDCGTHATDSRQHSKTMAKAQGSMPRAASQEGLLTYAVDAATAQDGSSGSGQDTFAKQSAREQHQANGHQSSSAAKASDRGQLLQTQPKQQQRQADEDAQQFVLWQPPPEPDSDTASAATRAAAATAAEEQSEQAGECRPKRRQLWYRCRQVQLTVLGYCSIALLSTFTNEVCAASEPAAPLHVDAGGLPSLQPFMALVVHGNNLSQGRYSSLLRHLSLRAVAPHRHSHVLMFG